MQSLSTLSSVEPEVCSDNPKMRIESLRPCCSWLSIASLRWVTSLSSTWILFSFSSPSFFNIWTVWDSAWTVSVIFCVTGSSSVLNIGSKISLYRSITASSSRVARVDNLNSSMTKFALARVSMACRHQRVRFHLTGSKEFDWPNGHSKFRNKVTFYPFFTQGAFFQYHQGILVTFIMSSDTTGNSNTSWGWWNSRFMGSSLHPVWSWAPSWNCPVGCN